MCVCEKERKREREREVSKQRRRRGTTVGTVFPLLAMDRKRDNARQRRGSGSDAPVCRRRPMRADRKRQRRRGGFCRSSGGLFCRFSLFFSLSSFLSPRSPSRTLSLSLPLSSSSRLLQYRLSTALLIPLPPSLFPAAPARVLSSPPHPTPSQTIPSSGVLCAPRRRAHCGGRAPPAQIALARNCGRARRR